MKRFFLTIVTLAVSIFAFADGYKTETDIAYRDAATTKDEYAIDRCKLDVHYPIEGKDLPVVIFFHGGGMTQGEKYIPDPLKECGFVIVTPNYRLMPEAAIDDCIDDAAAAVAWTFKNIERYGGDPTKIIVSGHSAGGYLTNMVTLDKKWLQKYDIDANDIKAAAPLSGQVITHFAIRSQRGMDSKHPLIDEYAPLYHVRGDAPIFIIISGDPEGELYGRCEETAYFWRMLILNGHENATFYKLDGFDHLTMVTPAAELLRDRICRLFPDQFPIVDWRKYL